MIPDFKNEAAEDFTLESSYNRLVEALNRSKEDFGREYPAIINGKKIKSDETIASINPSSYEQVVGYAFSASKEMADQAVKTAQQAFKEWKTVSAGFRARCLFKAAALMRKRKTELTAVVILESGKNWAEADGDVAEAIDFLDYYGTVAMELAERQDLVRLPGEDNDLFYIPLGVGVVISPWNFPLAIMTGMTAGPLVMGNTVIVKPASNTPVIAYKFMEIMKEAGVPDGAINLLYGSGESVGDYLVKHPQTRFISFTGSRDAGISIIEEGSKIREGQSWIKRISAEMGGKNAIIVDAEADLEAAVDGVLVSAFGFQGQKCSACSRAIIDEKIHEDFARRLIEKTEAIKIGPAEVHENYMGPLIDQAAVDKVLGYIDIGKKEGNLLCGGKRIEKDGFYIQPTIFGEISPDARLAQEEIFGPVLSLIRVADFEEALQIANATEYGLTGAVYSKNRARLEQARQKFHVGNLYFNRKCTSALVGVHPFGGYNMSGTGSKAGGKDYLLLFSQAKAISEKLP